jgi:hypothetical protein
MTTRHPSIRKSWHYISPTSGGRSGGIVSLRTKGHGDDVCISQETRVWATIACYWDSFTFLYVDDVCTSQGAYDSTACYGDSFTFLYVDDVRTSQGAYDSTACYGDSFTFLYVDDVRTSQEINIEASTARHGDNFTLFYF